MKIAVRFRPKITPPSALNSSHANDNAGDTVEVTMFNTGDNVQIIRITVTW